MGIERRKFIRHPLGYPISTKVISADGDAEEARQVGCPAEGSVSRFDGEAREEETISHAENIGAGGILFQCGKKLSEGTSLRISLRVEHRGFVLDGRVVRVRKTGDGKYSVAVAFDTPSELLKVRMMEQIVRIELYKNRLERRYKTKLDFGAVAKEWIRRYSKTFAERYDP